MDTKVLISLVSVALGWALAQGTALAKDWLAARKLRAGLLTELEDIQAQLERVLMIHMRHLQIVTLKGMEPSSSLPVHNMFFRQYFKEAFSFLNREQRLSYQLIHTSLENLNKKTADLADHAENFYKDHQTENNPEKAKVAIAVWGEKVKVIYKTIMDIRWHIDYHLRYAEAPVFDLMGPMHESYVKFVHEVEEELKKILETAETLKRQDFETIYDKDAFANARIAG
jgi:hypothetical protein